MDLDLDARADPEAAGFAAARLRRVSERLQADVAEGAIPGAVVLVLREDRVALFEAFGYADRSTQRAMQPDSIFRIASMTKPLTVAAALMLVERGVLCLADPVARHLPELRDVQVGSEVRDAEGERRLHHTPPRRPMSVHDLMRHTAGFTYGQFGDSLVQRAYRRARLMDDQQSNAEMTGKLAELPLAHQPGTTFEYGMSTDVLGRIVEVLSGMDLARFFAAHITEPLGMSSTGFLLGAQDPGRLAQPHRPPSAAAPALTPYDPARPPKWYSGGGGLLASAADYARFCRMLLNEGRAQGEQLLSRKSVQLMTRQHLPPALEYGPFTAELGMAAPLPQLGQGYGLGLGVRLAEGLAPVPGSVGDFYWGGALGPYFWVDPAERLIVVFMLQELEVQRRTRYRSLLRNLIYQALR